MLMYGTTNVYLWIADESHIVFNITSMKEMFQRLPLLIPPNQIGHLNKRDFDLCYADYIMSNDSVFKQFFDIIYSLYIGKDVYLCMQESEWSENLIESLLKLIQQRYGYDAVHIDSFDDYVFAQNHHIGKFNQYYGIQNLDIDKERYTYIVEKQRIMNGGDLIIYE